MPVATFKHVFHPDMRAEDKKWLRVRPIVMEVQVNTEMEDGGSNEALIADMKRAWDALISIGEKWFKRELDVLLSKAIRLRRGTVHKKGSKLYGPVFKVKIVAMVEGFNKVIETRFDNWLKAVIVKFDKVAKEFDKRNAAAAVVRTKRGANVAYGGASIAVSMATLAPTAPLSVAYSVNAIFQQLCDAFGSTEAKLQKVKKLTDDLEKFCKELSNGTKLAQAQQKGMSMSTITGPLTEAMTALDNDIKLARSAEKKLGASIEKLKKAPGFEDLELLDKYVELVKLGENIERWTSQLRLSRQISTTLSKHHDLLSYKESMVQSGLKAVTKAAKSLKGEAQLIDRTLKRLDARDTTTTEMVGEIQARKRLVIFTY